MSKIPPPPPSAPNYVAKKTPVSPREARESKNQLIPEAVIQAFNKLLCNNFDNEIIVFQDQVIEEIQTINPQISREILFKNHWLDIEDVYRANGWTVVYDKPGYNESYKAYWTFKPSRI